MMAYQLSMDKSLSIKSLRDTGMSERAIAGALGVSRNAVRRHLAAISSNDTIAPTGAEAELLKGDAVRQHKLEDCSECKFRTR